MGGKSITIWLFNRWVSIKYFWTKQVLTMLQKVMQVRQYSCNQIKIHKTALSVNICYISWNFFMFTWSNMKWYHVGYLDVTLGNSQTDNRYIQNRFKLPLGEERGAAINSKKLDELKLWFYLVYLRNKSISSIEGTLLLQFILIFFGVFWSCLFIFFNHFFNIFWTDISSFIILTNSFQWVIVSKVYYKNHPSFPHVSI